MTRCGLVALGLIKRAFITKSRGGTDEAGESWPPKSRRTKRATGLLLNSLSPGVASAEQVFRIGHGEVIVGTNRKGAAAQHNGVPGRLPQRRLWPEPSKWPASWWRDIMEQVRTGLVDIAMQLIKGSK